MESKPTIDPTASGIEYLTNHFFLPPKLPQQDDSGSARTNALIDHVTDSAAAFLNILEQDADVDVLRRWRTLHKMLESMQVLHKSEYIPLKGLRNSINKMEIHGGFISRLSSQHFVVLTQLSQISSPCTSPNKTPALSSAKPVALI
jgi:hypothetical protein